MRRYPVAAVLWDDSRLLASGWQSRKRAMRQRRTTRCRSVGFLIADDERGIVLAANLNASDVAGVTVIPRSAVRDVRRLS